MVGAPDCSKFLFVKLFLYKLNANYSVTQLFRMFKMFTGLGLLLRSFIII